MNKDLKKQLAEAKRQVTITAAKYGRASYQYHDAIRNQAALVFKQLIGK